MNWPKAHGSAVGGPTSPSPEVPAESPVPSEKLGAEPVADPLSVSLVGMWPAERLARHLVVIGVIAMKSSGSLGTWDI